MPYLVMFRRQLILSSLRTKSRLCQTHNYITKQTPNNSAEKGDSVIPRHHEAAATDTIFPDNPTVDSGVKQDEIFVGRDAVVADAYPMKSRKQFANTLEVNIRRWGVTDKLLGDLTETEISNKVMHIPKAYHISNWHSDLYHWNQNPADWRYRTMKAWTITVMHRSGAPASCMLLCLIHVCYLINQIGCAALGGKIPHFALMGITSDISIILLFTFY